MADVYTGSLAIKIEITLNFDLTSQTGVFFNVKKPDGARVVWTPTVDTVLTGVLSYVTIAGDLDQKGVYIIQPEINFAGKKYYGVPVTFDMGEKI